MSINSRFRVDIAPGSVISIDVLGEKTAQIKPTKLYGQVQGVVLRAGNEGQGGYAFTELLIGHTRNAEEQATYGLSTHPVYKEDELFSYAPLIEVG